MEAFVFQFDEGVCGDGFDLWDNEIGLFEFDDLTEGGPIQHGQNVAAVSYLHGRGIGVTIRSDDFDPEPLQLDDDFFAEFAGTEHEDFGRSRRERGADACHDAWHLAVVRARGQAGRGKVPGLGKVW